MTEIPEHLRKRAEEARKKAAAATAGAADAAPPRPTPRGGDAPQSEADVAHPRPPARAGQEGPRAGRRRRRRRAGGGTADGHGAGRGRRGGHRGGHRRARPSPPAPAVTPSGCSPSSSPARSRTSRPRRTTRCTSGRTCSSSSSSPPCCCTAFLLIFSIFVNAPLLTLANSNQTPNPSKAPWYFLGLQELLTMFHPMVAGVTIPGMGIFVLILAPVHRPQPVQQARGPQVRHLADHDLPHVLGGARHHRLVLPGPGLQLRLPVGRRPLLRAVRSPMNACHRRPRRRRPRCSARRSRSSSPACAGATPSEPSATSSRETRSRDQRGRRADARAATPRRPPAARSSGPPPSSAASAARSSSPAGPQRPVACTSRPTPRPSASPAGSSSTAASSPASSSASPASAPPCLAFLWPQVSGGLRLEDHRRQGRRHHEPDRRRTAASSTSPRAACGSPSTRPRRSTRPSRCTRRPSWPAWRPGSSRSTRSASHLGCRVPECVTSQWFECPCHGSQYNRVGEKKGGPAPRGLDRFAMSVERRQRHRRHRHHHPGPADRHQHHRPGGRGSALHHGGGEAH